MYKKWRAYATNGYSASFDTLREARCFLSQNGGGKITRYVGKQYRMGLFWPRYENHSEWKGHGR